MSAHETITKRQHTHSCITQTKCQKPNSVTQNVPMKSCHTPHSPNRQIKKKSIIKTCLPNTMYKVKLTYMKFTELLMKVYIATWEKKLNTHCVHPLL